MNTGDLETRTVSCIYSNILSKPPNLTYNYIVSQNEDKVAHGWNIDLRCKNFSNFNGFHSLTPLEYVKKLDLSYDSETVEKLCKILLSDKFGQISTHTLKRLTIFGDSDQKAIDQ